METRSIGLLIIGRGSFAHYLTGILLGVRRNDAKSADGNGRKKGAEDTKGCFGSHVRKALLCRFRSQ